MKNGQLLEEGITEAGGMSSLIAAGTSYATHGIAMLSFFFFYLCLDFSVSEISSGRRRLPHSRISHWSRCRSNHPSWRGSAAPGWQ